jgi:pseudouridine kinase
VVAIGGANMDVKCRIAGRTAMASSNPGTTVSAPGGVARNIAESLARLGLKSMLIGVIGRDSLGAQLLRETAAAGVDVNSVIRAAAPTGNYTAVLDQRGELVVGVAAMAILERLTPRRLAQRRAVIMGADLVVADSNLPSATLDWLIGFAAARDVRLAIETVSVPKGGRLKPLLARKRPLFALFCNRAELGALTGLNRLHAAVRALHALGARHVGVGLGRRGMFVSSDGGAQQAPGPARPAPGSVVPGAGDAAVAGTLYGLLRGKSLADAARCGQAAAALTLASERSVSPRLNARAIRAMRRGA